MLNRSTLVLVALVGMLGLSQWAAAADQVDNPAYKRWATYKVGTWVKYKMTMQMEGAAGMGGMTMTSKLVELTAEKAVLETSVTMKMGDKDMSPPAQKHDVPAKVDADKVTEVGGMQPGMNMKVQKKGEETIEIDGKSYKCQRFDTTVEQNGKTTTGKLWVCEDVPGGMVKMQSEMPKGTSTMELAGMEVVK